MSINNEELQAARQRNQLRYQRMAGRGPEHAHYLDIDQVGSMFRCSAEHIRKMTARGDIPAHRIRRAGGLYRWGFLELQLLEWVHFRSMTLNERMRHERNQRRNLRRRMVASQVARNNAHGMKSHALRIKRYPEWADSSAIAAIYIEAKRLTTETGVLHEVDHVLPLRGKTVSGLHVHQNLQVVTKAINREKNNRWQP